MRRTTQATITDLMTGIRGRLGVDLGAICDQLLRLRVYFTHAVGTAKHALVPGVVRPVSGWVPSCSNSINPLLEPWSQMRLFEPLGLARLS